MCNQNCFCIFTKILYEVLFTYAEIETKYKNSNSQKFYKEVYKIFQTLPSVNRGMLEIIFKHLRQVIEIDCNDMDQTNISRVFGPTLCSLDTSTMVDDKTGSKMLQLDNLASVHASSIHANSIIETMLDIEFTKLLKLK